jgi:phosphonate transport system substrate-binding protein
MMKLLLSIARKPLLSFALPVIGLLAAGYAHAAEKKTEATVQLTFGIVPQQSATKLARLWTPVFNYLSEKTGYRIHFSTAKDIPTFEKRCVDGSYDLAYMNPYHYTVFAESAGYRVFAKEELKHLKGIIVVRKDAVIDDLGALEGSTLAFPSPNAFAASVLTRAYLTKIGVSFSPRYVASHDSVYRSVAKGLYPAGGGVPRTFRNVSTEISDQLRILWTSKGYTPHALAAHPRVPERVVRRIQESLVTMNQDPAGQELLKSITFQGIVTARDGDYDDVRGLGIRTLNGPPEKHE